MSEADEKSRVRAQTRKAKRTADSESQFDLTDALEGPVRIKRDGSLKPIDPYEAMLRQHVRKSLTEHSVPSMKLVLDEAEKHKLIKARPPPLQGGVFVIPKELPEDIQRRIFDNPDYATGQNTSMSSIWGLVLSAVTFERFLECFNGRRNIKR